MNTPWKTNASLIQDPLLTLSNQNLSSDKKLNNLDRFVPQNNKQISIKNKLDFDQIQEHPIHTQSTLNQSLRKKQQKRMYNKLLYSSIKKQTKLKLNQPYQSKNLRSGYLVDLHSDFQCSSQQQIIRCIPKYPYKILDAPKLKDDFYNNLLDWSKDDLITVVLDNAAYIWSGKGYDAQKLTQGYISSVKWGKGLVIGQETGKVRVLDIQKKKQTHKFKNHIGRVGCIDTYNNLIATGSKDSQILLWDVREKNLISRFQGHKQEVCGLKWSSDGSMIASGGNDNLVFLWSARMNKSIIKFSDHTAAVKALAWSPHKNSLLATGGGSTDKTIKLWNTQQLNCIKSIDTGSQVCNMTFSVSTDQLISTHGYSLNSIAVWKVKNMQKIATLQGHSYRVLYLAKSPDQQTILTGSGDQTLRFWKIFPSPKAEARTMSTLDSKNYIIR